MFSVDCKAFLTYSKHLVLFSDTSALVNDFHVVGEQGIARVLGDDTKRDNDGEPPPVSLGAEEVEVAGGVLVVTVGLDGVLNLAELELDERVVGVATTVVLGEDSKSLLRPVLVDKETGGLGNPPDTTKLHDGGNSLDEGDRSP